MELLNKEPEKRLLYEPSDMEGVEFDDSIDLDQFQVVRREFFYHLNEPSVSFNNSRVSVNAACLRKLPDVEYVQFLISEKEKKLVIRPCLESDFHSFPWSKNTNGKKQPRSVTGRIFMFKICKMMKWNSDNRHKILGKLVKSNGEYLFVFDLSAVETYERIEKDGEKPRMSRTPAFPAEWKDAFGQTYGEQKKALQVSIFDDSYAVYSIQDNSMISKPTEAGNGE